jgi:hypothetical protein
MAEITNYPGFDVEYVVRDAFAHEIEAGAVSITYSETSVPLIQRLVITPASHESAPIAILWEPGVDMIYVSVGRNTSLEIDIGRAGPGSAAQYLHDISRAIADGKLEECVWMKHDAVIRSSATLWVMGRPLRLHSVRLFWNPFRRPALVQRYKPYLPKRASDV